MKEETEGGFANRFVYFCGDRKGPNRLPPEPELSHLNKVVQVLADARRRWHNTQFQLLDSAEKIWGGFYDEWFYDIENDVLDAITGRLPDNAMKLALQYALLENEAPEILPEQMEAAVSVARYWHASIRLLFSSYGLTETQQVERGILQAVSNGGKSTKELYDYFSHNVDARTLNFALESLQKVGKVVKEKKQARGGRGRPKVVFRRSLKYRRH
jgi:hypothetical protein